MREIIMRDHCVFKDSQNNCHFPKYVRVCLFCFRNYMRTSTLSKDLLPYFNYVTTKKSLQNKAIFSIIAIILSIVSLIITISTRDDLKRNSEWRIFEDKKSDWLNAKKNSKNSMIHGVLITTIMDRNLPAGAATGPPLKLPTPGGDLPFQCGW